VGGDESVTSVPNHMQQTSHSLQRQTTIVSHVDRLDKKPKCSFQSQIALGPTNTITLTFSQKRGDNRLTWNMGGAQGNGTSSVSVTTTNLADNVPAQATGNGGFYSAEEGQEGSKWSPTSSEC
jgi:hypothetical protein